MVAQKSAMTARSRGRKWKRESLKVQQHRVREEYRHRKAAEQRLSRSSELLAALQQRYGSYYALSIPSKVDRQPVWWWQAEDDKRLLVGVRKHGMDFRAIEEDEQLGFAQRLNEQSVSAVKDEAADKPVVESLPVVDPFVNLDTVDDSATAVSPALAAVNAHDGSHPIDCICTRDPKAAKAVTASSYTKQCARCQHTFHTACLDQARDDNTLRPEHFPPMPTQHNGKHNAASSAMDASVDAADEDTEVVQQRLSAASKAKGKASKGRATKKRAVDEDGHEDDEAALDDTVEDEQDEDEDEETASRQRANSTSSNSWLCDRCEMAFPADRSLEFRLRSLIEAFDRDRHAIARLSRRRVADKSTRPPASRKGVEESSTAWTRKDRLRVQRGVQLFGCTSAGIALMRRKMELTSKSESSLLAYCERLVAQCQLIVAQSRREQDEQSFQTTVDELKTRGEELRLLTERVDKISAKEGEVQRRREDRRASQARTGEASASSSEAEDTSMYCTCEGKVDDSFMVSCDAQESGCKEWYHGKCVGFQSEREMPSVWVCANCKAQQAARAQREDEHKSLKVPAHLRLEPPSPMSAHIVDRPPVSNSSRAIHSSHPSAATTPTVAVPSAFASTAPAVVPLAAPIQPDYGPGTSFRTFNGYTAQPSPPQHFASFHSPYAHSQQQQLDAAFFQQQQQQQQQMGYGGFMQQAPPQYMGAYGGASMGVPYGHSQYGMMHSPYFSSPFGAVQYDGYAYMPPSQLQDEQMLMFNLQQQQHMAMQQRMQQQYGQQQAMYGMMSQQANMPHGLAAPIAASMSSPVPVVPLGAQSSHVWPPPAVPVQPIAPPTALPASPQPAAAVPVAPLSHFSSLAVPASSSYSSASTPVSTTPTSISPAPVPASSRVRSPSKVSPGKREKVSKKEKEKESQSDSRRRDEGEDSSRPSAGRSDSLPHGSVVQVKRETPTVKRDDSNPLSPTRQDSVGAALTSPVMKLDTEGAVSLDELAAVPVSQAGVIREASWRVRRRLYQTAAAVMQRQIEKLKVELDNEMSKLHEWHKQRMQAANTFAASAAAAVHASSQLAGFLPAADTELTPLLAQKILSRVMLLGTMRSVIQLLDEASADTVTTELVMAKLSMVPTDGMPRWYQPAVHDVAVMRCVLLHGLGMIDETLTDPLFSAALASSSPNGRRETRDFFVSFLRDKGPLLRRMLLVCNCVQYGSRDGPDDWLDWLLTSKRDWKGSGYRVNSSLSGYNVTSSATLKALTDDTAGGGKEGQSGEVALLSIQSISNWARVREASLRVHKAVVNDDENEEVQGERRTSQRSQDEGDAAHDDDGSDDGDRAERRGKRRLDSRIRSGRLRDDDRADRKRHHSGRRHDRDRGRIRSRSDSRSPVRHSADSVPRDRDGRPKLPLSLSGGVTLLSLGRIVTDRPLYAPNGIIFPVGYKSRRQYYSFVNPQQRTTYTSSIEDDGPQPQFILTAGDCHDPAQRIVAASASAAWSTLIKRVHKLRGKGEGRSNKSGLQAFGLVHPIIKQLLLDMDGADVVKRRWQRDDDGKQVDERERQLPPPQRDERMERVKEGGRRKRKAVDLLSESEEDEDESMERGSGDDAFASAESDSSASGSDDDSNSANSDRSATGRRRDGNAASDKHERRHGSGSENRKRQR